MRPANWRLIGGIHLRNRALPAQQRRFETGQVADGEREGPDHGDLLQDHGFRVLEREGPGHGDLLHDHGFRVLDQFVSE